MADNKDLKENNDLLRQQIDLLKQRQGITEDALDDSRDFANIIADQTKQIGFQVSEKRQLRSISNSINKISQEAFSILKDELGTSKNLNAISKSRASLKQSLIGLDSLNGKIILENKEIQGEINSNIEKQILSTNKLLKELDSIEKTSSKVSQNFGVKAFSGIAGVTKAIPGLREYSKPFEEAAEASRKHATRMEGISKLDGMSNFKKGIASARAGIRTLGPALAKSLGPIALIASFVTSLVEADKQIIDIQRNMSLSAGEAVQFKGELISAAGATNDINITSTKLIKTFSSLNEQFGFITNFASDTLVTMTRLTNVVGVSAQSAGNLAASSSLTGKSFESNYKDVLGTSYELQRQEGVQFSLKGILEETGKVTGTVRANLGANPAQIAKAITQAKLFGASLQQVSAAGKSLLDFESSITSELEAELLLGKDINLEKARLATLNGDQATLAKELRKEAGTFSDFTKMNVIQQEALAKAIGMQSDDLADILFKQEVQNKSAKDLRALGKDDSADRLEQQTAGEKFNATIEKLKDLLVDVFSAVSPILSVFSSILEVVGLITSPFTSLIGAATRLSPILGGIVSLLTAAGIAALYLNSAVTFGVGVALAAGAAAVGIAMMHSSQDEATQVGDINSPANGKTRISTKEGGLFELSPNDDIIAAPGASRAMARAAQGQGQQQIIVQSDNRESKKTNQLLEQILSKQGIVKMDSTDVGTAFAMNTYQVQ